ncbi:MAG: hypothetical protein RMJ98_13940 [Myxococcales bacterium]|nr:hypothetical protein [Polyangiaceae bacterium]MDW8250392.1 hypothetical protein [Myxococcales bacterium]
MSLISRPVARFLLLAASLTLVGALSSGCCKKKDSGSASSDDSADPDTAPVPSLAHGTPVPQSLSIPRTGTSFTPPAGWEQEQRNEWTIVHVPPDAKGNIEAFMAFVTFNKPNESTRKIGAISRVFGLKSVKWGAREFIELPSGFPATGAGGTCQDRVGTPCEIHYYTINPGGSEQILFVYLVDTDRATTYKESAVAALKSLKKG